MRWGEEMDREKVIKVTEIAFGKWIDNFDNCCGFEKDEIIKAKEDVLELLKEHDTVEHALDILRKHGWKETEDVPYANEQERHPVIVCPHCGKRVK